MLWLGGNRCGTVTTSVLEFSSGACKVKHVHVLLRGGLLAPRGMRVRTVVQDPPVRARLPRNYLVSCSVNYQSVWNDVRTPGDVSSLELVDIKLVQHQPHQRKRIKNLLSILPPLVESTKFPHPHRLLHFIWSEPLRLFLLVEEAPGFSCWF